MPVGLSNDELPLSAKIVGRPNEDETVLASAVALEKAFWNRHVGSDLCPAFVKGLVSPAAS